MSVFDLDLIKSVYTDMPRRVAAARNFLNHPLSLTEKILYSHLWGNQLPQTPLSRGNDYVDFAPDRVAMHDATAQMALLQFMTAGRNKVAVRAPFTATTLF